LIFPDVRQLFLPLALEVIIIIRLQVFVTLLRLRKFLLSLLLLVVVI